MILFDDHQLAVCLHGVLRTHEGIGTAQLAFTVDRRGHKEIIGVIAQHFDKCGVLAGNVVCSCPCKKIAVEAAYELLALMHIVHDPAPIEHVVVLYLHEEQVLIDHLLLKTVIVVEIGLVDALVCRLFGKGAGTHAHILDVIPPGRQHLLPACAFRQTVGRAPVVVGVVIERGDGRILPCRLQRFHRAVFFLQP